MEQTTLAGDIPQGFENPVIDAQQTFRCVMQALSRPGLCQSLPVLPEVPGPLLPGTGALLLALADMDTPVWLDGPARNARVETYLRFHCGCPIVDERHTAVFAVVTAAGQCPALEVFNPGTPEYPDRSTTLIVQADMIKTGEGVRLTGPGIEKETRLEVQGVNDAFWPEMAKQRLLFPMGVDVILVDATHIAGLPRTLGVGGSECT